MQRACATVHLSVCLSVWLSVCLSPKYKNAIFSKTKQFRAMVSIDDLVVHGLFKEPIIGPLKSKMAEIPHLENRHDVIFFCRGWSDLDKISQTGAEWHVDCGDIAEIETRSRIPLWRTSGRIQWHVIPELHATLQGAATWRIQCHDYATSQSVIISCAILKIVFRHFIFFVFIMQFGVWRAAAFVSSPIHLFNAEYVRNATRYRHSSVEY